MKLTKKTTKSNTKLSNNVSLLKDLVSGRALIITTFDDDWNSLSVRDYYNIVISNGTSKNLEDPDFTIINTDTCYSGYIYNLDNLITINNSVYITSIKLIDELKKIKKVPSINNVNCLYLETETTNNAGTINGINAVLNYAEPAVHLAKILGCTTIFSTEQSSVGTTFVSFSDVQAFCSEKDPLMSYIPKNLIAKKREPAINLYF
jgi:hypothetical protein